MKVSNFGVNIFRVLWVKGFYGCVARVVDIIIYLFDDEE